ncbi:hypothetical protein [Candidatus Palauibacter sp.]|uniref:hypothetical protein n=1 Tax=Candidatus Palauibacter sp. TaxID=3101350 RepID=UPI003B02ABBD
MAAKSASVGARTREEAATQVEDAAALVGLAARVLRVGPDLAHAIERNPRLDVLLINGIYDFATPYFPIVWSLEHWGCRRICTTTSPARTSSPDT